MHKKGIKIIIWFGVVVLVLVIAATAFYIFYPRKSSIQEKPKVMTVEEVGKIVTDIQRTLPPSEEEIKLENFKTDLYRTYTLENMPADVKAQLIDLELKKLKSDLVRTYGESVGEVKFNEVSADYLKSKGYK